MIQINWFYQKFKLMKNYKKIPNQECQEYKDLARNLIFMIYNAYLLALSIDHIKISMKITQNH